MKPPHFPDIVKHPDPNVLALKGVYIDEVSDVIILDVTANCLVP